jgi:hypothetical protein
VSITAELLSTMFKVFNIHHLNNHNIFSFLKINYKAYFFNTCIDLEYINMSFKMQP